MAEAAEKSRRRAFSREFKLSVVQWFHTNDKNVLQTSNHFKVDWKQVRNWVKMETRIRKQKAKSRDERGRNAFYSRMDKKIFNIMASFHFYFNANVRPCISPLYISPPCISPELIVGVLW